MNLTEDIEPVTALKTRSAALIRRVRGSGRPVVITQHGKPAAILLDVATYQREREALLLLQLLSQGDQEHRAGRSIGHVQAKRHFTARLAALKAVGS